MSINLFDPSFYRVANPDLAAAGLTTDAQLFQHFQTAGIDEGRRFSLFADLNFYRSSNSDLTAAGLTTNRQLLTHLQTAGVIEGRRFSPFTDINFYLLANPDIAAAFGGNREQALTHLQTSGINEGRLFSQFFDLNFYRVNNSDLALVGLNSNRQLLEHFEISGINEGRQFSIAFNTVFYRNIYSDLAAAGLTNQQLYTHFQQAGLVEGRTSSQYFSVSYYRANNPDLVAAGFNNSQAYNHFVLSGFNEGRYGSPNGYPGLVRDDANGTAVPPAAQTSTNSADYDLFDLWQQIDPDPITNSWSATANINFANGQPSFSVPIQILDNDAFEGNQTVQWNVPTNAPFGFSQATYIFSENEADNSNDGIVLVELRLGSSIKTTTITLSDNELVASIVSTNVPQSIPDLSTITSTLSVSGLTPSIKDVNVTLDITHTFTGDLEVFLISPAGTSVELFTNVGSGGDNFTNTTLDDEASLLISSEAAPFTGSFSPEGFLGDFDFSDPNGIWTLSITDDAGADIGTLNSWSLTIVY